jgi:copper resistance protein B
MQLAAASLALGFQPAVAAAQDVGLDVDLLEVHLGNGHDHLLLDGDLTAGSGPSQLLVKFSGGSETRTSFDDFEVQAFYDHSLSETVALHVGVRHDFRAGSDLTHGAAGMKVEPIPGLEAIHYFYLSQDGDLTGGAEFILGLDIAPHLVLEPRLLVGWSAQGIPAEDLGHGLTDVEPSLRLRRSLGERFDIYTGVVHERLLGITRSIAVAAGDPARVTRAIVGFGFRF